MDYLMEYSKSVAKSGKTETQDFYTGTMISLKTLRW